MIKYEKPMYNNEFFASADVVTLSSFLADVNITEVFDEETKEVGAEVSVDANKVFE